MAATGHDIQYIKVIVDILWTSSEHLRPCLGGPSLRHIFESLALENVRLLQAAADGLWPSQ